MNTHIGAAELPEASNEALRLASWLDCTRGDTWPSYIPQEAAAELRRLHAHVEALHTQPIRAHHTTVVHWRNNGIEACAGIADAYGCKDAATDMRAMLTATSNPHSAAATSEEIPTALDLANWLDHVGNGGVSSTKAAAELRRLHARLEALSAAQAGVTDGYVLVPAGATEAMVRATDTVDFANDDTDGTIHNVWNVMLAAAPQPTPSPAPAQPGQEGERGYPPGYTDGGRNMFYEGRFNGETERQQKARLQWADEMRAAFERHTGNGWFDKDWRKETEIWSSAWRAAIAAQLEAKP